MWGQTSLSMDMIFSFFSFLPLVAANPVLTAPVTVLGYSSMHKILPPSWILSSDGWHSNVVAFLVTDFGYYW